MIYVISDTHFGHSNIIRYCDRPFANADEMNEVMVLNWQSKVNPEDTVIHIGDFAFTRYCKPKEILARLPGTKVLVRGNHDYSPEIMIDFGFNIVLESLTIEVNGTKYLISHHPIDPAKARLEILDSIGADFHIHGHVHNKTGLYYDERSVNVSVENTKYSPYPITQIVSGYNDDKELRSTRPIT